MERYLIQEFQEFFQGYHLVFKQNACHGIQTHHQQQQVIKCDQVPSCAWVLNLLKHFNYLQGFLDPINLQMTTQTIKDHIMGHLGHLVHLVFQFPMSCHVINICIQPLSLLCPLVTPLSLMGHGCHQ